MPEAGKAAQGADPSILAGLALQLYCMSCVARVSKQWKKLMEVVMKEIMAYTDNGGGLHYKKSSALAVDLDLATEACIEDLIRDKWAGNVQWLKTTLQAIYLDDRGSQKNPFAFAHKIYDLQMMATQLKNCIKQEEGTENV